MSTPKLRPVRVAAKGHNRYCGPAAISIITGIDTAEASAVIRHATKKQSVKGTSNWDILRSLSLLGYRATSAAKVNPNDRRSCPTLAAWLRSPERDGQSLYLVSAGYHWQVVQGRRFCCGVTKEIVSIRDPKVMRRARVAGVWKIEQERKVALAEVLPAKPKRDTSMDTVRRKAKALAREIGVEIETSLPYDGYQDIIVWGPRWADDVDQEEVDPFYNDHYAEDWEDALERVKDYAELKRTKPDIFA